MLALFMTFCTSVYIFGPVLGVLHPYSMPLIDIDYIFVIYFLHSCVVQLVIFYIYIGDLSLASPQLELGPHLD